MKIAHFVPSWPPGVAANGIVTYASQLVPALRRLGHEVFVLTPRKAPDDNDAYTIDLRKFASTPNLWDQAMFKLAPETAGFKAGSAAIASAVRDLVERHGLDVFEMEDSFGWSFAITRLKLLPVVVRLHGPWFLNGRFNDPGDRNSLTPRRQEWEGRGIRHAQCVTSPSAEVLQAVNDRYGFKLAASRTIPNPLEAVAKVETWDVSTCNTSHLLFVGRFDRRKGGDLILRVFGELGAIYPKLRLTFIGPDIGLKEADGNIRYFEQYVRDCVPEAAQSRIEFRGQMNHSDVMSLRRRHFATLIASQYEIMPYSLLEAMSLGCAVVATAVGGIPELIKDERNGLLVPSQDVGAMTAACRRLIDDHALATRLGRQAWQDCSDLYGPENVAKQTIAAYQEAIDRFNFRKAG